MSYDSMKATKISKKSLNTDFEISRSTRSKAKRSMKKLGFNWLLAIIFLVIGAVGGFFVSKYAFKSDTYSMIAYANGETDVYIGIDETLQEYTELGVKCIAFGKDVSKDFTVTYYFRDDLTNKEVEVSEVDETKPGIYYAVYKAPSIKYSSVKLIRNIIVTGDEANV